MLRSAGFRFAPLCPDSALTPHFSLSNKTRVVSVGFPSAWQNYRSPTKPDNNTIQTRPNKHSCLSYVSKQHSMGRIGKNIHWLVQFTFFIYLCRIDLICKKPNKKVGDKELHHLIRQKLLNSIEKGQSVIRQFSCNAANQKTHWVGECVMQVWQRTCHLKWKTTFICNTMFWHKGSQVVTIANGYETSW